MYRGIHWRWHYQTNTRERQRRLSMIKREREGGREKQRAYAGSRPRYCMRYTWIIDFVHERATTGASKIPVALLIVVNCLLYMASFQMRFRRSSPSLPHSLTPPQPLPNPSRTTGKSNCDSSCYRYASSHLRSYHPNRTFLYSVRSLSLSLSPAKDTVPRLLIFFLPRLFPPVAFIHRVPLFLFPFPLSAPCFFLIFFPSPPVLQSRLVCLLLLSLFLSTYIILYYPLSFSPLLRPD